MLNFDTSDGILTIDIKSTILRGRAVTLGKIERLPEPLEIKHSLYTHEVSVLPLAPVYLKETVASDLLYLRYQATQDPAVRAEIERIDGAPLDKA